jgi:hypothetical protein
MIDIRITDTRRIRGFEIHAPRLDRGRPADLSICGKAGQRVGHTAENVSWTDVTPGAAWSASRGSSRGMGFLGCCRSRCRSRRVHRKLLR